MDPSKAKAEKEEKERLERLEREAIEAAIRAKILAEENVKQGYHLVQSGRVIKVYDQMLEQSWQDQCVTEEWQSFLACRPIPDLRKLFLVNAFLSEWILDLEKGQTRLQVIFHHTSNILELLEEMRDFLHFPPKQSKVDELVEMGVIYHEFQKRQQAFIDRSTYNILIDLEGLYDPELGVIDQTLKIAEITHALWCNYYSRPELVGHSFEDTYFRFHIPEVLVMTRGVYRLLKLEYDPYSDSCHSFFPPRAQHFYQSSIQNWIWDKSGQTTTSRSPSDLGGGERAQEVEIAVGAQEAVSKSPDKESMGAMTKDGQPIVHHPPLQVDAPAQTLQGTTGQETAPNPHESTPDEGKAEGGGSDGKEGDEEGKDSSRTRNDEEDARSGTRSTRDESTEPESGKPQDETTVVRRKQETDEQEQAKTNKQQEQVNEEPPTTISEKKPEAEDEKKIAKPDTKKSKKGKGKPNGKEERTKTEAELAKDRERAEKAFFHPVKVHQNELNLRNYIILGGIYDFKLLEIPPQPMNLHIWTLHSIEGSRCLKEIEFLADYTAPVSADLQEIKRTPEEMEREAKRQEEELQKLVLVEIKVPKIALWFEPPTPVRWEEEFRVWSTEGFHDIRFNEDSLQLSFKTTMFGTIGLGHNRWSNLPYQSWELRPNGQNGVILSLMAAMAVVEFTVYNDVICVSSLQNVSNSDVIEAAIIDKFMKPGKLIQALKNHGLDLFPEFDSYAYVDGVLVKHPEAEEHMYQCMAIGAVTFNFHWSRWNMLAGRNKMVYQIRERHGTTTPGNYQMVLNTPRSAALVNCTEVSPNYSEEPAGEYEYHADLLHLIQSMATDEAKDKMEQTNGHFVETLRILLSSVKCLSYS